ncbi:MAG: NfeD family protein [Armatimonadota bacterium]
MMQYFWLVLAGIFIIGELITGGFFLICFGIAAAITSIFSFLKFSAIFQWLIFAFLSFVIFLFSRKFADKIKTKNVREVGADRLLHKIGIVIEEINSERNTGIVRVENEEWRAVVKNGEVIPRESKVKVIAVDGTKLIVEKID